MNTPSAPHRLGSVLLAEDNESDVQLVRESLHQSKLALDVFNVQDGEQCLAFLRKEEPYSDAPTPDLVLLDLNMPVMDGREVLAELVRDERLNHLPVVIVSTSQHDREVLRLYKLRCSAYVVKPVDFNQFHRMIQELSAFWFNVVVLPHCE